jgi:hypothetical protein
MRMTTTHLRWAVALLLTALPCVGLAQGTTPPATPGNTPPSVAPGPKPLSPQQQRETATMPGELRPERPTVPQINVPLGKGAADPAPNPQPKAASGPQAASAAGVNDAVARCEAEKDKNVRARCRARLAREGGTR